MDEEPTGEAYADAVVHLGSFHPAVAERVEALVRGHGVAHRRADHDDHVALAVDRAWVDDLRAELVTRWPEVVGQLPDEQRGVVTALGGELPGWHDAPHGGWVDRAGRLVVEEPDAAGELRVMGPALVAIGAVLLLVGWYADTSPLVVVAGIAASVAGLVLPR